MKKSLSTSLLACLLASGCGGAPSNEETAQQQDPLFAEPTDTTPRAPSAKSRLYRAEAIIDAPVDVVWNALVDLPSYEEWNPFLPQAKGTITPGSRVEVTVMMGPIRQKAAHIVMTVDPQRAFCWRDTGWTSRFVYGQRCRWLEATADGKVRYTQTLQLDANEDGINMTGAVNLFNGPCLQDGVNEEAAALKLYAERKARP